jgi:hypothetical protein
MYCEKELEAWEYIVTNTYCLLKKYTLSQIDNIPPVHTDHVQVFQSWAAIWTMSLLTVLVTRNLEEIRGKLVLVYLFRHSPVTSPFPLITTNIVKVIMIWWCCEWQMYDVEKTGKNGKGWGLMYIMVAAIRTCSQWIVRLKALLVQGHAWYPVLHSYCGLPIC